jgi:predicted nucleotidyltransferase
VFVVPTPEFWSLDKPPTHLDGPAQEQFSWEVERFCELAVQANPTVLECLWSPIVEVVTATGSELLAIRQAFLSQRLARSYGSYAQDQLRRIEAVRARTGEVKWKQAMHMARLLMAGAHVLRTREILVDVSAHRERLLAVKRGEMPWERFGKWVSRLDDELAHAAALELLPIEPDRSTVNDFLARTRREHL